MTAAHESLASTENIQELTQLLSNVAKSYNPADGPAGHNHRMEIVGLAHSIIEGLTDPSDLGNIYVSRQMELVTLRTLLELKVFQAIPPTGTMTLAEVARATGAQESLLERLLRMMVCTRWIHQDGKKEYSHTKFSLAFAAVPGPASFFQTVYDESFLMIDDFHLYLQEKGLKEPTDQRYSPYAWKSKQEGTDIWTIMQQHPARFAMFQAGLAHASASVPITEFYDWSQLKTDDDRAILVDIGGATGYTLTRIMRAHPDLPASRLVLQDLPPVIEAANRDPNLAKDIVKMAHDFHQPQPVQGARAYFMRMVMHDYADDLCIDILKQIVPAMAEDSRILVSDFCFPPIPSAADLPLSTMDITILNMGGKERSEDAFKALFEAAGLEYVCVYRSDGGFGALVEARLPKSKSSNGV